MDEMFLQPAATAVVVEIGSWEAKFTEAFELDVISTETVALQRAVIEKRRAAGGSTEAQETRLALYEAGLDRRRMRLDELQRGAHIRRKFRPR